MRPLPLLLTLGALALAGCPGPQFLNLDVATAGRPVPDAYATAVCEQRDSTASRTDRRGRARLKFHRQERKQPCTVTVAKPGFSTHRFEVDRFCEDSKCQPMTVELDR